MLLRRTSSSISPCLHLPIPHIPASIFPTVVPHHATLCHYRTRRNPHHVGPTGGPAAVMVSTLSLDENVTQRNACFVPCRARGACSAAGPANPNPDMGCVAGTVIPVGFSPLAQRPSSVVLLRGGVIGIRTYESRTASMVQDASRICPEAPVVRSVGVSGSSVPQQCNEVPVYGRCESWLSVRSRSNGDGGRTTQRHRE